MNFRYILLAVLFINALAFAQTPGISYQAVILDDSGIQAPGYNLGDMPLANANVDLKFTITDEDGTLYVEEFTGITTDENGMVSLILGIDMGDSLVGSFSEIVWDGAPKDLGVEIDVPNDNLGYRAMGDPQPIIYIPSLDSRISSGEGTPTGTAAPADIYIEESTGDVYTYDGDSWVLQGSRVSADINNLLSLGSDNLPFLDASSIAQTSSGSGTPSSDGNPGDIYVDESTGDIYIYDGTSWSLTGGTDGYSAYDIWIDQGHSGSESDFLDALKGQDGADGDSAFEIWASQPGNEGLTEADYLASIQGPTGAEGPQGIQGAQGLQGIQGAIGPQGAQGIAGPQGPAGLDGADGTSVTILGSFDDPSDLPADGDNGDGYLINGDLHVWDGTQYVNAGPIQGPQGVVGQTGPQGPTGPQGAQGIAGPQGPAGLDGADGTSVTILGSFDDPSDLPADGDNGDGYLINGDLHVWDGTQYVNAGPIQGPAGPQGPQGLQGPTGAEGPQGIQGEIGDRGPAGPAGPTGDAGQSAFDIWASQPGNEGLTEADYLASVQGATGNDGADGQSAYEIALAADPTIGTETEWLASLQGADGATGAQGATGNDGADGQSAYEIALAADPTIGTETEWLASLQGADGATGAQGATGPAGTNGQDGQSAYEIALAADPTIGTETEWLASLQGADGATGAQGATGPAGAQGATGNDGADGQSAYEIALAADPTIGTETEWLASLQGADGATGAQGATGNDGADGNGIASSADNGDGTFTLTFDDGTTFTTADLTGPAGAQGATGNDGADGQSAYEIALAADPTIGTETEWLASLQGADGATGAQGATGPAGAQGATGPAGTNGQDGQSAYEIALAADPTIGTETEWLASLQGADGATGAQGATGPAGAQGATGNDGADGQSAYEIALAADPTIGTETEWLASLQGADGATGAQGATGNDGADGNGIASSADNGDGTFTLTFDDGTTFTTADLTGPAGAQGATGPAGTNGQDGQSAYEIALAADPTIGTETEWLASLQGADGATGAQGATGPAGAQGATGNDGADGNGIASSADNGDGTFTLTFDDGTTFTTADLTGPAGAQGATGNDGADGQSAYEIALAADPTIGTETEWLASLQGADGATGAQGATGPAGAQGAAGNDGATGPAGTNGADGNGIASSADNGDGTFTLTFDDGTTFTTADLTGPAGATGPAGPQGDDSTDDQTAAEVSFDDTNAGLGSTDVQGAIEALDTAIADAVASSTDDQTIDTFQINGDNLELSLENDGEAVKTVALADLATAIDTDDQDASEVSLSPVLDMDDDGTDETTVQQALTELLSATKTAKKVFHAEYEGAALYADGTDNDIFITSDYETTGAYTNYYEISNELTSGNDQDFHIILQYTLPDNFNSWASTSPMTISYQGTSNANFQVRVREGSTTHVSPTTQNGSGLSGFSTFDIGTASDLNAVEAGDKVTLLIKVTVSSVSTVGASLMRLGDITFNYNRNVL